VVAAQGSSRDSRKRYVLRYRGRGGLPAPDLARIEREVHIVDRSPRLLLVEATSAHLARLLDSLPRWIAADERGVTLPDARPHVQRPA
jgi:hypothetical protein